MGRQKGTAITAYTSHTIIHRVKNNFIKQLKKLIGNRIRIMYSIGAEIVSKLSSYSP